LPLLNFQPSYKENSAVSVVVFHTFRNSYEQEIWRSM